MTTASQVATELLALGEELGWQRRDLQNGGAILHRNGVTVSVPPVRQWNEAKKNTIKAKLFRYGDQAAARQLRANKQAPTPTPEPTAPESPPPPPSPTPEREAPPDRQESPPEVVQPPTLVMPLNAGTLVDYFRARRGRLVTLRDLCLAFDREEAPMQSFMARQLRRNFTLQNALLVRQAGWLWEWDEDDDPGEDDAPSETPAPTARVAELEAQVSELQARCDRLRAVVQQLGELALEALDY